MKCEKAFDRYLSLDKNERVPLLVTCHLLGCKSCRTAVRYMVRAEKLLAGSMMEQQANQKIDPVIANALERISEAGLSYPLAASDEDQISLIRWMVSGVALIAGFTILPFSSIGAWSRNVFGDAFSVPFYILSGVAITAYCALFVGTNIDFFVKKFGFTSTL